MLRSACMTKNTTPMRTGLLALALQCGIAASALAGGPALLELPLEGVTKDNRAQCIALFEKKMGKYLTGWDPARFTRDVTLVDAANTTSIRLRLGAGHVSLSAIEEVLAGSPFSIVREQLEFHGVLRLELKNVTDAQAMASSLATLDGKNLLFFAKSNDDGSTSITLSDPKRQSAPLFTHERLTTHIRKTGVQLVSINWGLSPGSAIEGDNLNFHCRPAYGARPIKSGNIAVRR